MGAEVASTWPVMITSAICRVKGTSSQKPRPQASTTCGTGATAAPAATTITVASSAKMKASGTHRSLHVVSTRATRVTGPVFTGGRSCLP